MTTSTRVHVLNLDQCRRLALDGQGLTRPMPFGKGKKALVLCLRQIGYVQIDTISVVERAHHHVIWSRVPHYTSRHLDEMMNMPGGLFEYWSHAAAFLPMEDYRFSLIRKDRFKKGEKKWFPKDRKLMQSVLDRIRDEGPLSARHFDSPEREKKSGWWNWKPAKIALEQLFHEGSLMVRERQGFQKVYDLTERVLPEGINRKKPTMREYAVHLVETTLRAHGMASLQEICYQRPLLRKVVSSTLDEMIESGAICRCRPEGSETTGFFVFPEQLDGSDRKASRDFIRILSPFDNAVIQRNRLKTFFDFDYLFECYVPASKRRYGYFSLPLLWGDRFVGMIDCKAHRTSKILEVNSLHTFDISAIPDFRGMLRESLKSFAAFNQCDRVQWKNTQENKKWKTD